MSNVVRIYHDCYVFYEDFEGFFHIQNMPLQYVHVD
jgi:hypothetical protein